MKEYVDLALACRAMRQLQTDDIKSYGVRIPECFNADRAIAELMSLPAADVVERKCGHCLPKARYFYCSECGYAVSDVYEGAYDHDDEKVFVFEKGESWRYCPNCGTEMELDNDTV